MRYMENIGKDKPNEFKIYNLISEFNAVDDIRSYTFSTASQRIRDFNCDKPSFDPFERS